MKQAIEIMKNHIVDILSNNRPSIYLYGSIVLEDFKLEWSDIDFICLTESKISDSQATQLLNLRQELLGQYKDNLYFRSFEGSLLSQEGFINGIQDTVVYWGTSGQRIADKCYFDPFSMIELIENGYLLFGNEIRYKFSYPTREEIIKAIVHHYETIRKYAVTTEGNLYSAGWMLDIARCIYTLKTGKIISKTKAGEWALNNNLTPDEDIMKKVINIRREPCKYKDNNEVLKWLENLGRYIQRFADVLEKEILIEKR